MKPGFVTGFLGFVLSVCAQTYAPGPQVTTFFSPIDDTDQPYGLYLPRNHDPNKPYPLVISLHGASSNHRLNLKRVFGKGNRMGETDAEATRYFPPFPDVDFLVASPLARGTLGYVGIPEADVYAVLEDVKKRFLIDEDRVYLTGLSMGGGGAIYLALTRPDIWAAVAPVCPAVPVGTEPLTGNGTNIPFKIFQGEIDPVVKPEAVRGWRDRLEEAGVAVEYVEYPGVKHNSWDNAYANASLFGWLAQHKRDRMPKRVRYTTSSFKYPGAYWVEFDSFTPGAAAAIDARITAPQTVEIKTGNLDGFTLKLNSAKPWKVTIDGKQFSTRSLSFQKQGQWRTGKAASPAKRTAGVMEALGSRHVYLYPAAQREAAERLSNWATPRRPLLLTLRSFAVEDVKPADLAGANLVLLGTRETNSMIPQAPLRLRPGAADYTLITTAPAPDRQIVIVSGKPPMSIAPQPFAANLVSDYLLMRGDDEVIRGNYDRDWKVLEGDKQKLLATGVIEVD